MNAREFMNCWEGYQRAFAQQMRTRAWELAHHVNLWSKRKVSPKDLWDDGPPRRAINTPEEFHAEAARVSRAIAARKRWELEQLRARRQRRGRPQDPSRR